MAKLIPSLLVTALLGGAVFWVVTEPSEVEGYRFKIADADATRGEAVFLAAGCGSCHAAPGATGEDKLVLSGGQRFETPYGTFIAPNISPHPTEGIGSWGVTDLANAVMKGVSPEGEHYYPAFPWDSYAGMTPRDLVDLDAYLRTLPVSDRPSQKHELFLPLHFRRAIGLWKFAFAREGAPVLAAQDFNVSELRGRYLVEVLGHCSECHTPRNGLTGAPDMSRYLQGGPDISGKGRVPDITGPGLGWSAAEVADFLSSGMTPDYDSVGGHMALVVDNYAKLPEADRKAVADYLQKVPGPKVATP